MNPPLRDETDKEKLKLLLKIGKIDWIESDHAPHAIGEKLHYPFLSGYPSLYLYKNFVKNFLPGLGIGEKEIEKMTFTNIKNTFKKKLGSGLE
ncbi:hypothetical protein ACFLQN_01520 [Candidatus Aenigmatarchaeota archaeon]